MNAKPLILIALCATLTGCLTASTYEPVRRYDVVPTAPSSGGHAPSAQTLAIRTLAAAQPYKEAIVYREDPYTVSYRHLEEWVEPPRDTVTRALSDALDASGYFADVGDASQLSVPTLILTGEIRRYDEMRTATPWEALCEVRIEVREVALPRNAVWTETYRESVAMTGDSANALAVAMTEAVDRIVARATKDIIAASKEPRD